MSQLNVTTGKHGRGDARTSASAVPTFSGPFDLVSLFECPVCFDYVLPPILQCRNGHLNCGDCRSKLTCCPICSGPLGNIRNLAMEKVASNVMFPCKYSTNGCTVLMVHTVKRHHEDACEFRPYSCPSPGSSCKWQGSLEQVMPHLMMNHNHMVTLQGEDVVLSVANINQPGTIHWMRMQSCFGHHFILVLKKQEKYVGQEQFVVSVQLIGSREQAENFMYRFQLNGHRRELTWKATPRSIHESVSSTIRNSGCLIFDKSTAEMFADNGRLDVNVNISMT